MKNVYRDYEYVLAHLEDLAEEDSSISELVNNMKIIMTKFD